MTTTNGQHSTETPAASTEPVNTPPVTTSSVLPLDGWGPITPPTTPEQNGSNGVGPIEPAPQAPPAPEADHIPSDRLESARQTIRSGLGIDLESQLIGLLAPLAVMAAAVFLTFKLTSELQTREWRMPLNRAPALSTSKPTAIDTLRRRVALAIDPSLTPQPQETSWWRKLIE